MWTDVDWNEAEHPRDGKGRFNSGGGAGAPSANLTGKELGEHPSSKELRVAARDYAKEHLVGNSYRNANSGVDIDVTYQGIKHAISGANEIELKLMPALPRMLQNARYIGSSPDREDRPDIKAAHKYVTQVKVGDEVLTVGIVVREMADGHRHYDHFVIKEDPVGTSGATSQKEALGVQPSAGSVHIVAKDNGTMKTRDKGRFFTTADVGAKRSMTPEGFLVCHDVPIARTGVQLYLQDELTDEDGEVLVEGSPDGLVRIDRLPEQVFRPETIASFEGKAVTVEHPDDFVNPGNWQQLAIGTTQNVRRGEGLDDDLLIADLVITDLRAIAYVNEKLPEVSAGYEAGYEQTEPGRGVQRDIVGNHVALVERGRAGPRCSIQDQEPKMTRKTVKRSFADRIRAAFMSKDAEAAEKLAQEAEDEDAEETDEEKAEREKKERAATGDALGQILAKLKSMDEDIKDLKKAASEEEETEEEKKAREAKEKAATGDTVLNAEEAANNPDAVGKVLSGDSLQAVVARAEILSPGATLKTSDGKAKVIDVEAHMRGTLAKALTTDAGKAVIEPFLAGRDITKLTGDSLTAVFTGAAELARAQNNQRGQRASAATRDFGPVSTVASINARNREFWANRINH